MRGKLRELYGFVDKLMTDPRDLVTRVIFADWLDENDEPELADYHRKWSLEKYDAEQYLKYFCYKYSKNYKQLLELVKSPDLLEDGLYFGDDKAPRIAKEDYRFWDCLQVVTNK